MLRPLYKEKECSGTSIIDSVRSRYGENFPDNWRMSDTFEMRQAIGKTAKDKEWFKRIDRGEFLGSIVFKYFNQIKDKKLKEQLENLSNWVDE